MDLFFHLSHSTFENVDLKMSVIQLMNCFVVDLIGLGRNKTPTTRSETRIHSFFVAAPTLSAGEIAE